ncbi:outer membrane beta-barrel protein [Telluribacter sp. SYSU D00476]|uniref:outer membrane beta-barrel protein n=1 Tax=Telluribacter sp. SYSU D00476 TaxID=2811430 RepID=UPI001FF3BF05|nr:outer membrane beta-barrel protein [Telluribacter sp. SYSU D00476]
MNKQSTLLLALLTLLSFSSLAQTDQGTWMVGLSGNGSFKRAKYSTTTSLQLAPQLGYFIGRNLALGTQFSLDYTHHIFFEDLTHKAKRTSFYGLSRYYIGNWKARPYVNLMVGRSWNRDIITYSNGVVSRMREDEAWNTSLGAGVAYFVGPKVAIEADANYRYYLRNDFGRRITDAVTLRFGLSLYLK